MTALSFLLLVVVVSLVGTGYLLLRQRTPHSIESSIDEFHREMHALSPGGRPTERDRPPTAQPESAPHEWPETPPRRSGRGGPGPGQRVDHGEDA